MFIKHMFTSIVISNKYDLINTVVILNLDMCGKKRKIDLHSLNIK